MINRLLLVLLILQSSPSAAQPFTKATNDAYLITVMAGKFHVQPRILNDAFSKDVFNMVLQQLDEDKLFFTLEDIHQLDQFKTSIDDEIIQKKALFLSALNVICSKRLALFDTLLSRVKKNRFDLTLKEKTSLSEDSLYPANEKQLRDKLTLFFKATVLDELLDNNDLANYTSSKRQKYVDSIEPILRKKVINSYKQAMDVNFNVAGDIKEAISIAYCKAIARCYDPHTDFFPVTEKENFESQLGQQPMVFGFQLKEQASGAVTIETVMPGSAAFKSGQINKGDQVLSVQWENQAPIDVSDAGIKGLSNVLEISNHDKAIFTIRKPDGSERSVILYKEKTGDTGDDKVKSFLLRGSKTIGFISLPAFYQDWESGHSGIDGCANDVANEILKLKKDTIQGLILDLRYNGGGSMQEAVEMAGIFVDAGPVAQFKTRDDKVYVLKDVNRGTVWSGPLMIMVNGYSASASEMLAGTLQDYRRAVIIGSPTYGKATAQVVLPMDSTISMDKDFEKINTESYLKLTVSQLYRVNGTTAQAKGVQPDILLPDVLDVIQHRESGEAHVLVSLPIEGNKYFHPGTPILLDTLKSVAKLQLDASLVFGRMKKYLASIRANISQATTSLNLADRLSEIKQRFNTTANTPTTPEESTIFKVENNLFEKQQMTGNNRLEDINQQWSKFLSDDPYVRIAYQLISLMK